MCVHKLTNRRTSVFFIYRCFNGADGTVMAFSRGITKKFGTTEVTMEYEFATFIYDANPTTDPAIWFETVVCLGECTVS